MNSEISLSEVSSNMYKKGINNVGYEDTKSQNTLNIILLNETQTTNGGNDEHLHDAQIEFKAEEEALGVAGEEGVLEHQWVLDS